MLFVSTMSCVPHFTTSYEEVLSQVSTSQMKKLRLKEVKELGPGQSNKGRK